MITNVIFTLPLSFCEFYHSFLELFATHMYTHKCVHAHTHKYTHAHTHTYMQTHTHTRTHTCKHKHTHTHPSHLCASLLLEVLGTGLNVLDRSRPVKVIHQVPRCLVVCGNLRVSKQRDPRVKKHHYKQLSAAFWG